jgi:hypothetical protein
LEFAEDLTRGFLRGEFQEVGGTEVDAAEHVPEWLGAGQPVPFPCGLMLSCRLAVSGLGQFRVTRYEFWLLRLHCGVHRLPGVVLWLRGRLAIRRLLAHD